MADGFDLEAGVACMHPSKWSGMQKVKVWCCCGCCVLPTFVFLIILLSSMTKLGPEEQLVITRGTGKEVINGPRTIMFQFGGEVRKAIRLSPQQYATIKNVRTGIPRQEVGPQLLFMDAWDEMLGGPKEKTVLRAREYIRLVDTFSGLARVEVGPQRIIPGVFEKSAAGIQKAWLVKHDNSLLILNRTSGRKKVVREEGLFIPGAFEEILEVQNATIIKQKEYAVVRDTLSGKYRHEEGAQMLFLDAYEELVSVRPKISLQMREYVRLVDKFTGVARIVVGPKLLTPEPSEDGPGGIEHDVKSAITITSQLSVILFDRTSGKKYEMRTEGVFFPGAYEDVLAVRRALVLKSQEYAVTKNNLTGIFVHHSGPTQLFVGPYEELITVLPKVVLQKQEYVRLVDRRTGTEVVVKGPQAVVPEPSQCEKDYVKNCTMTAEQAIVMKADIAVLTLNRTSGIKKIVRAEAGGNFIPMPYESILEIRKATILKQQVYAIVKDNINGEIRHALGPQLLHLEATEELLGVRPKVVLHRFQYLRLVNERTGVERVVEGPQVVVPDPTEVSTKQEQQSKEHDKMFQHAVLIDKDNAILVLNQTTGEQRLVDTEGMWVPQPYEYLVEKRPLLRVMANEAVIVRDSVGQLTVHDGTAGGAGTSFFLPPRSRIVTMSWSSYEAPDANGVARVSRVSVDKIDMRIQRTFYSYTVRTNDNVRLMLMGTIFWRVTNVTQMVLGTSDPSGDVWHHCRSSFMQALSNTTFDSFMGSFNQLAKVAYERDVADDFYDKRGVALLSMEVTRFEAMDAETKATLKQINEETIKQITLLKKQEGENAVQAAKMRSDIALAKEKAAAELDLEAHKTKLIETRGANSLIEKKMQAEGDAQPFALHAKSFISALNETGVDIGSGLGLYRSLREAEHHNIDTKHLSSGKASLFLTSKDVGLKFRNLNLGDADTNSSGEHNNDL